MYRPPGILDNQSKHFETSSLPHKEKMWFCNPSSYIYIREQKETPSLHLKEAPA